MSNIAYSPANHLTLPAFPGNTPGKTDYEQLQGVLPGAIILTEDYSDGQQSYYIGDDLYEVKLFIYDQATGKRTPSIAVYVDDPSMVPLLFNRVVLTLANKKLGQLQKEGFVSKVKKQTRPDNLPPAIPSAPL